MTQPSIQPTLPSITSSLPSARYSPTSLTSFSIPPPPLFQPRTSIAAGGVSTTSSSSSLSSTILPPLGPRVTLPAADTLTTSPPNSTWRTYPPSSPAATGSQSHEARSSLSNAREQQQPYSFGLGSSSSSSSQPPPLLPPSQQVPPPSEPWQPKPRQWDEQPMFDLRRRSSSPRMQQSYGVGGYSMPVAGPSYNQSHQQSPSFGGGSMGSAFPEFMIAGYLPPTSSFQPHDMYSAPIEQVVHIGSLEYTQALDAARHIRAAIPHLRAVDAPTMSSGSGQSYRSILDCASTALDVLSGRSPGKVPPPGLGGPVQRSALPSGPPETKRPRMTNGTEKDKSATFCRGCGATETPEWRRGPLGPRTLCNACGLVHMKMMRKKKKQEEKAAAAAKGA